jgi:hypothetical protein
MVRGHMINNNSSYKNISTCATIFSFKSRVRFRNLEQFPWSPCLLEHYFSRRIHIKKDPSLDGLHRGIVIFCLESYSIRVSLNLTFNLDYGIGKLNDKKLMSLKKNYEKISSQQASNEL